MIETLNISEIFGITIQGEGALIGKPTVFVRAGGCDFRCSWCDTLYAVLPKYKDEWVKMSPEQVFAKVRELSPLPILVTLSGGNPAMQPFGPLVDMGHQAGYTCALETQGSIMKPWMRWLDYLTLSPKPPSSGMSQRMDRLDWCFSTGAVVIIKVVVFDEADYMFARSVASRYPGIPFYLQPGNETVGKSFDMASVLGKLAWLIELVKADQWNDVTVLPQLHTLLWGNRRGV